MEPLALGPFMLNREMIFLLLSALAGYVALRIRMKYLHASGSKISMDNLYINSIFIGFVVWKFSLILFDPKGVFKQPEGIIYFDGGSKGIWLAVVVVLVYLLFNRRKNGIAWAVFIDAIAVSWFGMFATYHLLFLTSDTQARVLHVLAGMWSLMCLVVLISKKTVSLRALLQMIVVFGMIAVVGLTIYNYQSETDGMMTEQPGVANVGIQNGHIAPDFELISLDGDRVQLTDYRGKRVVLNFWATWCGPCRVEMPHMEDYYTDYDDKDVVVLGVNLTFTEKSAAKVSEFVKDYELTFPIVYDEEGVISRLYRVVAYPTTYIIDSNGMISEKFQGAINYETIQKSVSKLQ